MRNATYAMMEAAPAIPTFTPSSVSLGHWAIGGVLPDYRKVGEEMAMESVRMDNQSGNAEKHLQIIESKAVMDSRKAKEWGLDPKALPFGVELINQPVSFYQQYTYQIWSACTLFVVLVLGLFISLFYYFRTKRLKDELLRSDKDLRVAKDRAEESNRLKSAFLANMSHEIRTPLNAIVGFSELLASASTEEEKAQFLEIVHSNNELLQQLIADILDLSKIEAGTLEFTFSEVDVNQLMFDIEQLFRMRLEDKSAVIQIIRQTPPDECVMYTDRNRLQQVVSNFMTNAVKFTDEGSITFGYNRCAEGLYFYVKDTGSGIPEDKVNHIFERFVRVEQNKKGTGLGLAICEMIIRKLGGKIGVESEYGKGSTFWFTLPINGRQIKEQGTEIDGKTNL